MEHIVDLYIKLLIGTFSFIGPSFSLLIPIFYPAIERAITKHKSKIDGLQRILANKLAASTENFVGQIDSGHKQLAGMLKDNQKELNLLNPKRQIRRLFTALFLAIFFIGMYQFWEIEADSPLWIKILKWSSLVLSFSSFCYVLNVLWQIFCTVLTVKAEEIRSQKEKNNVKSQEEVGVITPNA